MGEGPYVLSFDVSFADLKWRKGHLQVNDRQQPEDE